MDDDAQCCDECLNRQQAVASSFQHQRVVRHSDYYQTESEYLIRAEKKEKKKENGK